MTESSEDRIEVLDAVALPGHAAAQPLPGLRLLCRAVTRQGAAAPPAEALASEARLLAPMRPELGLRLGLGLGAAGDTPRAARATRVLARFAPLNALLVRLQLSCGWPVCGGGAVESLGAAPDQPEADLARIVWPSLNPAALAAALPWIQARLGGAASAAAAAAPPPDLGALLARLERVAPPGVNTAILLAAAARRRVPIQLLPGVAIQYGWSARSRWMESSATEMESVISARLARDKALGHALLREAGLPVPLQAVVASVDEACAAARRFGYPVVLKPGDLDGGIGVASGLRDEAALRRAYDRSRAQSAHLVLETHIEGEDYRLGVVDGRHAWTTRRTPAGVEGDGIATLAALVARANQDPRRSRSRRTRMRPIELDAEAVELLAEQGLQTGSVPAAGRFVRLRRATNIDFGGEPLDVLGPVHPDNAALAERIARLFRLRIAGIDLITPDIARSWREAGGAVCEVNAKPQIPEARGDVADLILAGYVPGEGRVPIVLLCADWVWNPVLAALQARLAAAGLRAGFALADGVVSGGMRLSSARRSAFADTRALLFDPAVDAILVATDGRDFLRLGLPVDRVDIALVDAAVDGRILGLLTAAATGAVWRIGASLAEAGAVHQAWVPRLADAILTRSTAGGAAAAP